MLKNHLDQWLKDWGIEHHLQSEVDEKEFIYMIPYRLTDEVDEIVMIFVKIDYQVEALQMFSIDFYIDPSIKNKEISKIVNSINKMYPYGCLAYDEGLRGAMLTISHSLKGINNGQCNLITKPQFEVYMASMAFQKAEFDLMTHKYSKKHIYHRSY